ncbi:hypothetical protein HETIRDRAFT_118183 [Heterobasidion irregulare TC 32-1]|uniref:Uncharacterized protein n=1 Tax=Heterobasidion irregulare (strain TC 32-1) TaxID=747525 RepID=W4K7K8_HETIT|nr:uncharacterized protein HETIRDRAFT_118183 [Heterobasidion irregulare TC 32-1]ETW81797.1 hypothetical protein HETIRDRAFT_118183 [Heterobasidion irregulare TC 32-1]
MSARRSSMAYDINKPALRAPYRNIHLNRNHCNKLIKTKKHPRVVDEHGLCREMNASQRRFVRKTPPRDDIPSIHVPERFRRVRIESWCGLPGCDRARWARFPPSNKHVFDVRSERLTFFSVAIMIFQLKPIFDPMALSIIRIALPSDCLPFRSHLIRHKRPAQWSSTRETSTSRRGMGAQVPHSCGLHSQILQRESAAAALRHEAPRVEVRRVRDSANGREKLSSASAGAAMGLTTTTEHEGYPAPVQLAAEVPDILCGPKASGGSNAARPIVQHLNTATERVRACIHGTSTRPLWPLACSTSLSVSVRGRALECGRAEGDSCGIEACVLGGVHMVGDALARHAAVASEIERRLRASDGVRRLAIHKLSLSNSRPSSSRATYHRRSDSFSSISGGAQTQAQQFIVCCALLISSSNVRRWDRVPRGFLSVEHQRFGYVFNAVIVSRRALPACSSQVWELENPDELHRSRITRPSVQSLLMDRTRVDSTRLIKDGSCALGRVITSMSMQTHRNGAYSYETLASAALSMDDAAHLSTHHDENLFGFFSSSFPSQHSSPLSPPSEYGATDPYSDLSGPSSRATIGMDLYAGAHYGAQQVDTPVSPEMGYDRRPAQTWAPAPSRMSAAYWLSDEWNDVTNVAHAPAAHGSPVHTGEAYNTLADGPAAEFLHNSLTASMDAVANYVPVQMAQKRRAEGDVDKGRIQKRPRHAVDPTPKGKRTPPDPRTGLVPPGETWSHTSSKYKTVDLEDSPRDRQTLASVPPAETGASTQRGPNRPIARASKAAPELEPEVPGEDGRKVRKKAATPGKKKIICAWPVCLETGKMCTKGYGRQHDMLRHVQSKHLRIPRECPNCGTYVFRELGAHQRRRTCVRAGEWSALVREMKAQSFLEQKEVTGVVGGEKLLDSEVRSLLEAIRALIEAGRSQPDDIEDGIDGWMKQHRRVWQKVMGNAHGHAPPS